MAATGKATSKDKGTSLINAGSNVVTTVILLYAVLVGKRFYSMIYPVFPEFDANHNYIEKYGNTIRTGSTLKAKLWVAKTAFPVKEKPLAEFDFVYDWDEFKPVTSSVAVNISEDQMKKGKNTFLSAEVWEGNRKIARAKGTMLKSVKRPDVRPTFKLLEGKQCVGEQTPDFGKGHVALGIPWMQVRIVYDQTMYPPPWTHGHYFPQLFVDEFWMTDDQLVKMNQTGVNSFKSEIHFGLMSAARWRFQRHMESSFEQNAKLFGENSEEMLQIRDLFANTNSYLLLTTLIVSVLHMIFEFLAFKSDVLFFRSCNSDMLNKYVSIRSIAVGIIFQIVLLLYLWDESANIIVLVTSLVSIFIDLWKVQRAMRVTWKRKLGFIFVPCLEAKTLDKQENFDSIAMYWLSIFLLPGVVGYAIYTLWADCHRGWYSYILTAGASCVYSLGFVLMTPQVFINYKHKSVAYLPWRKFVYRALTTFIDDLFALIIRMPTMHRLSCFRDDIVFFIYLYQRRIYPVDMHRTFDEDGYELSPDEGEADNNDKKTQ
eukprot:CAMPEP_0117520048 /NCGR_PEP_ID=MMETSP0784-20121206/32970_1 /TAXON_ID=39447 /ORGANISM="" /LENGTH=541 /DNA_ID=CAMNT_0005316035 /DNA_START=9 /DNA_END=1634 /DNA_ORIENTATION=-